MLLSLEALYVVTVLAFKISLSFFFLRVIVRPIERSIIIWVLTIFTFFSVGYLFFAIFQCGIPSGSTFWIHKLNDKCAPDQSGLGMAYTHAVLTAGTDLIFLVLPIPLLRRSITFRVREKIVLGMIMGLGTL
jgi:hypothetical protein